MRYLCTLLFLLTLNNVFVQYKPVDDGSTIEFTIKHFGIPTSGRLSGLSGSITFDIHSLNTAKFDVSVQSSSVNTGINLRDNHLRDEEFFWSEKYPTIRFVSTGVKATEKKDILAVTGNLILKGITKEITLPFTVNEMNSGYIFKGNFAIDRGEFHIGHPGVLSDNVMVVVELHCLKDE